MILQLAEALRSPEVAVISAEPAPTAVTTPLEFTVATFLFEVVHFIVLSDAETGEIVALETDVAQYYNGNSPVEKPILESGKENWDRV